MLFSRLGVIRKSHITIMIKLIHCG